MEFEDGEKLHYKEWDLIAGRDYRYKDSVMYIMGFDFPRTPLNKCFCCEYVQPYENGCKKCPIDWVDGEKNYDFICEESSKSPYKIWMDEKDIDRRKELAAIIRDKPWIRR